MTGAGRYLIAGDLTVDLKDERAFLDGEALGLSPKPFALLRALMGQPQVLVTKEALIEEVWGGLAFGDAVLTTAVKETRHALGDPARTPTWIETVHGRGYRFLKPVERCDALDAPRAAAVGDARSAAGSREGAPSVDPPTIAAPTPPMGAAPTLENPAGSDQTGVRASRPLALASTAPIAAARPAPAAMPRMSVLAGALFVALVAAIGFMLFGRDGPPSDKVARADPPTAGLTGLAAAPARSSATPPLTPVAKPPAKSIAVLPFDDMSPDGDQEYFSDGVAEEILNALVRAPALHVAARTSSFAFRGRNLDLREVSRQLNVETILEGSVRKQGDSVRVTAQLIQASDGYHLWSDTYDGSLSDIFELQERIARNVADELAVLLDVESGERLAKRLTSSKEAYDLFLKARSLVAHRFSEATLSNAIALLDTAVDLDPDFAEAWAELARATYFLPQYLPVTDADAYLDKSNAAARRALDLDPSLARAYLAIAATHSYRGEFVETYEALSKAMELDPGDADIVGAVGYYWSYLGHPERALPLLEEAADLDPINVSNLMTLGIARMNAGQLDEAEALMRRAIELGHTPAALILPQIFALQGRQDEAVRRFAAGFDMANPALRSLFGPSAQDGERGGAESGAEDRARPSDVVANALYGDDAEAIRMVRAGLEGVATNPDIALNPAILGMMLQSGQYDLFMRTFQSRAFGGATFVLNILWDDRDRTAGLRRHPDFPAFAERVGLAAAWRVHGAPSGCEEKAGVGFVCA